jgi:signal transduction histidine kinase/DNA-binding response OmpR family regulator
MDSLVKKLLAMVAHVQVLFVFLAFALMVFLSYYFMSDIERRHLLRDVNFMISNAQNNIEADLLEPETTLGVIAETVRNMLMHGEGFDEVRYYLTDTTKYIASDERLMSYASVVYGVFDIFDGVFWSGREWIPPGDYVPQERPWYNAAVRANGKVAATEPYYNRILEDVCITFSRRIFDDEGVPLGVICLDVLLDKIREYALNSFITNGSYGILLDKQLNVIAHPHPAYLGKPLRGLKDESAIINNLMRGRDISEYRTTDYNGVRSVVFAKKLKNGWYMVIIAYAREYYKSVTNIGYVLTAFGFVLAMVLSVILLRIVAAKKNAEERAKVMLDTTPLCANFWDKNLELIDCSQEAVKLFSLSSKEEYLEKFYELSPKFQPNGRASMLMASENVKKAFDEGYCRFEWMHCKLSGEQIPCEITLIRVMYKDGYIVCGYSRDLREFKSMMEKIREADECSRVIFDATPICCCMFDRNYQILECSMETVKMFGLSDKREFLERFYEFSPEYQPDGKLSKEVVIYNLKEAFDEGYRRIEYLHQNKYGELIPCEVTLVRVKYRGEYAIAGYARDLREFKAMIAEVKRAEIAEESNKAKSDFLAKMSHEIRTPMNAILGITEIQLQDETLPLVTKDALERIYNSGDLLLGIINDILDLSKIEAGKLEIVPVQYDIASLVHDTVKLNILRYESKPVEFVLTVSENVPSILIGDELRIKQILNNLISNAFKYTHEGMINMTLSVEPLDPGDNSTITLIFIVSDTGQGMTSDQVHKLGDSYSRFNLETNRKTEGTGLGMNITLNLISMMNGDITVESTPGMGSTFTVRLPQKYAGSALIGRELAENLMRLNVRNTSKMRNAQITQEYMPYGHVLVVDDVETNLYVARGLMTPYGLTIDTALSGFETIDKIRGGSVYDIIFMDHMMPKMDGIEAVKIIRDFGYKHPIIALTANALSGQAQMFLNNGFDDFISKPIDIRQLNASLNKYIRDKQTPEVVEKARKQKTGFLEPGASVTLDPQLAEFFVRDAEKALEILSAIYRNKFRRGDDVSILIINVHAMKSALANIGEFDLSAAAFKIEQAGRDQELNVILSELPLFIDALSAVIEKLKPGEDGQDEKTAVSDEEIRYLQEKLLAFQEACAALDKKNAKAVLAEIRQKNWPHSIREHLSAIAEYLLHSEFEEAAAAAGEIKFS